MALVFPRFLSGGEFFSSPLPFYFLIRYLGLFFFVISFLPSVTKLAVLRECAGLLSVRELNFQLNFP